MRIPRRERTAGYRKGELQFHTPPQRTSGVWGGKAAVPYPAAKKHRGMGRESGSSIPRREETAGYGERKRQFHTPPQRSIGVWGGKAAVPYPAAKKHRGMGRESGSSIPRRKEPAGYGKGELQFHTPLQRSIGVWGGKAAVLYPAAREQRGMGRESCSSIPRRKEASGYGEGNRQFHTPP